MHFLCHRICRSFVPLDSVSAGSHHFVVDPAPCPCLAAFVTCFIQNAEQVVLVVSSFLAGLQLGPVRHPGRGQLLIKFI